MEPPAKAEAAPQPTLIRGLSLMDSVLLMVGGIIGSAIWLTAGQIADEVRRPSLFLLVWVAGGFISLLACFAVAELGAMYPEAGGQYVYLREAYGNFPAFLFGWMNFSVGNSGSVATLCVGFAEYTGKFLPFADAHSAVLRLPYFTLTRGDIVAVAAITVLTVVNILGLRRGAVLQNAATLLKFAAIAVFVVLGFAVGSGNWSHYTTPASSPISGSALSAFGVALIAVLWAYDGWVYVTWVAGEVKNPQRTLPRATVGGIIIVAAVYVTLNMIYLYALPMDAMAKETTIAQAAAAVMFSPAAARWLSAVIAVSCFGAASTAILTGARVYYAMAQDKLFFRRLAEVHPRWRTPALALALQGVWSAILAVSGRYDQLFTYVMFGMVLSYLATVAALFVLRRKRPDLPRPYRCTGYPYLPALYLALAGAYAVNAAWQRPQEALAGTFIILLGVPGYVYWRREARTNR